MIREDIDAYLQETCPDEEILLFDGFDSAFLGVGHQHSKQVVAIYDRARCIEVLAEQMSHEEAEEYFVFNTESAWVGDQTPIIMEMA